MGTRVSLPYVEAKLGYVPIEDGFQETPPIWWHTLAPQWQAESGTSIQGKYNAGTGTHEPVDSIIYCDTLKQGSFGSPPYVFFTGIDGSPLTTWIDTWISPITNMQGLLYNNPLAPYEILQASPTQYVPNYLIVLHRGVPAKTLPNPNSTNDYTYIEFNYGDNTTQYRLGILHGQPLELQYKQVGITPWVTVATCSQSAMAADSDIRNGIYRIMVRADMTNGVFSVNIIGVGVLRHSPLPIKVQGTPSPISRGRAPGMGGDGQAPPTILPNASNLIGTMPSVGCIHMYGAGTWVSLEVHPADGTKGVTVNKTRGKNINWRVNMNSAKICPNVLGDNKNVQLANVGISQDGNGDLSWIGSAINMPNVNKNLLPQLSDVLIYFPPRWTSYMSGDFSAPDKLKVIQYNETQTWDDVSRLGYTTGSITFQNWDSAQNDLLGMRTLQVLASNGTDIGWRLRGVCGADEQGFQFSRHDPENIGMVNYSDYMFKLRVPLAQEVILDGFDLYSAIGLLLEIGSISEKYRIYLPPVRFPPYPDAYTAPILGKGSSLMPKYRFTPDVTVIQAITALLSDAGVPFLGSDGKLHSIPLYMYFTPFGQVVLVPYNPYYATITRAYDTDSHQAKPGCVMQSLSVSNSVFQMRTDITVQGQDAWTYELINVHRDLGITNRFLAGQRYSIIERNERISSDSYAQEVMDVLQRQCSLGTQLVNFQIPADPTLFAGNIIQLHDSRLIPIPHLYQILQMNSVYGMDSKGECVSNITARNIENSLPY
jgi:hypothetical protein